MTALPGRTVEAGARRMWQYDLVEHEIDWERWSAHYRTAAKEVLAAAMDPALGPDRLVVAGEHEREVRVDQTRRIVEWLRGRSGAHGGGFSSADDVRCAIEREFGGGDDAS